MQVKLLLMHFTPYIVSCSATSCHVFLHRSRVNGAHLAKVASTLPTLSMARLAVIGYSQINGVPQCCLIVPCFACRVQQLMLSNTAVKITSLLFVALPAVLVGGEAYSYITGQPASNGFIKIYSVLLMIPGMHPHHVV